MEGVGTPLGPDSSTAGEQESKDFRHDEGAPPAQGRGVASGVRVGSPLP